MLAAVVVDCQSVSADPDFARQRNGRMGSWCLHFMQHALLQRESDGSIEESQPLRTQWLLLAATCAS